MYLMLIRLFFFLLAGWCWRDGEECADDDGEEDGEDDLLDYMSDDDDLNYRLSTDRKRKAM